MAGPMYYTGGSGGGGDATPGSLFVSAPHGEEPSDLGEIWLGMDGSGTESDPYVVTDDWDLQAVGEGLSDHYVLDRHIDATGTSGWNDGDGFTPIGQSDPFEGSLDGAGHVVYGLGMEENAGAGLIHTIGTDGSVSSLGIEGAVVEGGDDTGVLAGVNEGTVSASYTTGEVTAGDVVGGLVGTNDGSDGYIVDCYSTADVDATGDGGGLVGTNASDATVERSFATGSVSADPEGGLVGENSGTVTDSYHDGEDNDEGSYLDTDQMQGTVPRVSMSGFNFARTWGLRDDDYPALLWQDEPFVTGIYVEEDGNDDPTSEDGEVVLWYGSS